MKGIWLGILLGFASCYSFKGISIDPEVNFFYVETFEDVTGSIPIGYNEIFSEELVQKILNESRLDVSEDQAQVLFSGKFTRFKVQAEDPGRDAQTNLNRLYMSVEVTYYNTKTEEEWTEKFDEVQDFGADVNFSDVEDELLSAVSGRIIENVFNKAFTRW